MRQSKIRGSEAKKPAARAAHPATTRRRAQSGDARSQAGKPASDGPLLAAASALAKIAWEASEQPGPLGVLGTAIVGFLSGARVEYELAVEAGRPLRIVPALRLSAAEPLSFDGAAAELRRLVLESLGEGDALHADHDVDEARGLTDPRARLHRLADLASSFARPLLARLGDVDDAHVDALYALRGRLLAGDHAPRSSNAPT